MAGFLYVTPRGKVQGAEPSGAVAESELIARNDNYCNLTELPDHSAFAFSDDTTVYVARQPDFWPRAIVSNLDDLCSFDLEWVAK